MRNIVFGVIGVLWGGAIVVLRGVPEPDSAYAAGQLTASVLGFLMIGAGAWALRRGIRSRRTA
jgi:hypothetical protein